MRLNDLKDSVTGIHVKDHMQEEIIENVKRRTGNRAERQTAAWHKVAAAAALLIVISGVVAFPVRAFVKSLVRERMEAMSEEEVDEILETSNSSLVEADGFSRDYTDSEKSRYEKLAQKYQSGTFPEREIPKVENEEDAKEDELCFIIKSSTFNLPDRELTDEEILEIMDFYVKRDYAYEQNYEKEYAEEIREREEEQKEQIANNIAEGGITKQQAIEIAAEKLYVFFGTTGEDMELNSYYSEGGHRAGADPCYCVNWGNVVTHQIYYLDVRAKDGQIVWVRRTNPDSVDAPEPTIEEAKGKIDGLKRQAEEFMRDKTGIPYEKEYVYYLEYPDGTVYNSVRFVFETASQETYGVTYLWDGTFDVYAEIDASDYQDGGTRILSIGGEKVEYKVVFQELSIE